MPPPQGEVLGPCPACGMDLLLCAPPEEGGTPFVACSSEPFLLPFCTPCAIADLRPYLREQERPPRGPGVAHKSLKGPPAELSVEVSRKTYHLD